MMITRRDFLKYCTVSAAALGLTSTDLLKLKEVLAKEGGLPVIWLHGASCSGDSTSLLNSIGYMDPVALLVTDDIDLEFHQTVMNASGNDLATATDGLDQARKHLSGAIGNFAGWTTETVRDGFKAIKLRLDDRSNPDHWVDAKIYPKEPLLVNEFKIDFKFKTGEYQAPYLELDLMNQDTGATTTISSHYPGVDTNNMLDMHQIADTDIPWLGPPGGALMGPTNWVHVTLVDYDLWTVGSTQPLVIPGPDPNPAPYMTWAAMLNVFPTWLITRVRIVNRGNPLYGSDDPCTIYIDAFRVGGLNYNDGVDDDYIAFNAVPESTELPFVLCIEGSVVTGKPKGGTLAGEFCEVGPMVAPGDPNETMLHAFLEYSKQAVAVLAVGTCASYGGIPGVGETGAKGCAAVLKANGIRTPVINIPGCPAHPDWIVGTIAQVLARGVSRVDLDSERRVKDYYPYYVCNGNMDKKCPWIFNNDRNADGVPDGDGGSVVLGQSRGLAKYKWSSVPAAGETYKIRVNGAPPPSQISYVYNQGHLFEGCLGVLGCRGRKTKADCAYRKWNSPTPGPNGVNWCVGSRGMCQGCTDKSFPSKNKFYYFR